MIEALARTRTRKGLGIDDGACVVSDSGRFAGALGQVNRSALDLCCGTGQLAVHFLEAGYRAVGIDASEPMLAYASQNARNALLECGWRDVYFAQGQDLQTPIPDPEMQARVFIVAGK